MEKKKVKESARAGRKLPQLYAKDTGQVRGAAKEWLG
jgi:hypothetical protein